MLTPTEKSQPGCGGVGGGGGGVESASLHHARQQKPKTLLTELFQPWAGRETLNSQDQLTIQVFRWYGSGLWAAVQVPMEFGRRRRRNKTDSGIVSVWRQSAGRRAGGKQGENLLPVDGLDNQGRGIVRLCPIHFPSLPTPTQFRAGWLIISVLRVCGLELANDGKTGCRDGYVRRVGICT